VEAMAFYLAQCIAAHPEAQKLAPKQLQDALSNTLQVRLRHGTHCETWSQVPC